MSQTAGEPSANGLSSGHLEDSAAGVQVAPGPEPSAHAAPAPNKAAPKKAPVEEEEEEEDEEFVIRPNIRQQGGALRFIPQESGEIKPAGPPILHILGSRIEHHNETATKTQTTTDAVAAEPQHADVQPSRVSAQGIASQNMEPRESAPQQQESMPKFQPEHQQFHQQAQPLQVTLHHQYSHQTLETTNGNPVAQTIKLEQHHQYIHPEHQGHQNHQQHEDAIRQHTLLQQGISPQPLSEDHQSSYTRTVTYSHQETHANPSPRIQVQLQPAAQSIPVQSHKQPARQEIPQTQFKRLQLQETITTQPSTQPQQQQVVQQRHDYHLQHTQRQSQQQNQNIQSHTEYYPQQRVHQQQPKQLQSQLQPLNQYVSQYPQQQHTQQQEQGYKQGQSQYHQRPTDTESHAVGQHAAYDQSEPDFLTQKAPLKQATFVRAQSELTTREPGSIDQLAHQYVEGTKASWRQRRPESYKLTTKIAGDEAWIKEDTATPAYIRGTPWSGKAVSGRQRQWPPPEPEKVFVPYKSPVIDTPPRRFPEVSSSAYPPYGQLGAQQYYQNAQDQFQQQQFSPILPAVPTQLHVPKPPSPAAQTDHYQIQHAQQYNYDHHQQHQYQPQYQQESYQYPQPGHQVSYTQYEGPKPWGQHLHGQTSPGHVQAPHPRSEYQQPNQYLYQQHVQQHYQEPQQQVWIQQQDQLPVQFQGTPPEGWRTTTYQQLPGAGATIVQEQRFHDEGIDPSSRPVVRDVHSHNQRAYTSSGPSVTTSWGPVTEY